MTVPATPAAPTARLSTDLRRGSVREVATLAWPVLLQTLSETLMSLVDSAMVGRLGAAALGAIGFAGVWIWTAYVPFTGAATGVQTFVSQSDGAGEPQRCGGWVWQALWLLLPGIALWAVVMSYALPVLFAAIGPSPELLEAARPYLRARLPGAPAVLMTSVLMSFFRGIGDTKTPLVAVLAGQCVNVVLAYGWIFGALGLPALGIAGAGLAMTAAAWVMAAVMLGALLRRRVRERYHTQPLAPRAAAIARFARTSAAIGGQWLLDMVSFAMFTSIVARMGDASMAASQAMLQLLSISFMQAVAIGVATGTLVGRALGAGDPDAAARSCGSGQILALVMAAAVAGLFLALPESLIGLFSDDEAVLGLARPLLALGAFFQVADAIGIVIGHALRGAGDTRWPLLLQASLAWLLRLPLVYAAALWLEGGVFGAWLGELAYVMGLGIAFSARFRSGRWRSVRI